MTVVSLYVIGTELTRGIIEDKHIPLLTKNLTELGLFIKRAEIVPDDGTIGTSLKTGSRDSDIILVTGGLGPTSDDMTRHFIADLANVPLEKNQEAWDTLYKRIGEKIYGANEVQTMIPRGFELIPNPNGTAAGFKGTFEVDKRTVFIAAMPGPPLEMQPMFFNYMIPSLASLVGAEIPQRDEYSVFLTAEAKLEELCMKIRTEKNIQGVDWGTRFQATKISLYLSGRDSTVRKAFIEELRALVGVGLIYDGDVEASDLFVESLINNRLTVSTAESATAGFLGKMLTEKSGSSAWYWGGMQTYSIDAKVSMLGVDSSLINQNGTVSIECAMAMARNINSLSKTSLSLSITGVAGPGLDENNNPLGTVCFGYSTKAKTTAVCLHMSTYSREATRRRFAIASLLIGTLFLEGKDITQVTDKWQFI